MKTFDEIVLEIKRRIKMCEDAKPSGDLFQDFLSAKELGLMEGSLKSLLDWIESEGK